MNIEETKSKIESGKYELVAKNNFYMDDKEQFAIKGKSYSILDINNYEISVDTEINFSGLNHWFSLNDKNKEQYWGVYFDLKLKDSKPKNNFAEFGVEVPENINSYDYELKDVDASKNIIGSIDGYATIWKKDGECLFSASANYKHYYNLTPIKKPWYEDESNFPCIMISTALRNGGHPFALCPDREQYERYYCDSWRPATEEEAMQLVIKE